MSSAATAFLPRSSQPATTITTVDLSKPIANMPAPAGASVPVREIDVKLVMVSLQGLVNGSQPRLYLLDNNQPNHATTLLHDYYRQLGVVASEAQVGADYNQLIGTGPSTGLLATFAASISGLVVIPVKITDDDSERFDYRLNAATNAAGVEKLLIVPESMLAQIQAVLPGKPIAYDMRPSGGIPEMLDPAAAEEWSSQKFLPSQSDEAVANLYFDSSNLFVRDYVIAHAIHTSWWPGRLDEVAPHIHDGASVATTFNRLNTALNAVLLSTPPNIPILGSWQSSSPVCPEVCAPDKPHPCPRVCGLGEYSGVMRGSEYGKFTMGMGFDANYSFHSGVRTVDDDVAMRQSRARARPYAPASTDPGTTYVALTMVDSNDTPAYLQYGFQTLQWGDPFRGRVPVSWSMSVSALDLMPALIRHFYETATANDYFFASVSGLGYSYQLQNIDNVDPDGIPAPFCGYGYEAGGALECPYSAASHSQSPVFADNAAKLNVRMHDMDLDATAFYPINGSWTSGANFEHFIAEQILPGLSHMTTMAVGWSSMNGINATNANTLVGATGLHHALTNTNDESIPFIAGLGSFGYHSLPDDDAVNWMVGQIEAQRLANQHFIHAPGISWKYGPRRFYEVVQKLRARSDKYVFVTLDELDARWRQSTNPNYIPNRDPWGYSATPQWCSRPGSMLVRGDVNGDGKDDSICHDTAGYWSTRGTNLTGTELSSLTGWCLGDENRLYAGEWTGDGIVDFMCYRPEDLAWSETGPHPRLLQQSVGVGAYVDRTILKNYVCTDPYVMGDDPYRWLEPARASLNPGQLACYDHWGPNGATELATPESMIDTGFGSTEVWPTTVCGSGRECHLADFSGDHKADLVAFDSTNGSVYVAKSTGNGFLTPVLQTNLPSFCRPGTLPSSNVCETGDIDGDGKDDLVAFLHGTAVDTAAVRVAFANPAGTGFLAPITISTFFCISGQKCRVARLDGNSFADLVAFTNDASALVWASLSHGRSLADHPQLWHSFFCTTGQDCELGDVNADGRADLIAFGHPIVWVSLSTNQNAGDAEPWSNFFCPAGQVCRVGDVDHDGKTDVVAFTHDAGGHVWVGAAGGFSPLGGLPLGPNKFFLDPVHWTSSFCSTTEKCLVGDVTGDGAADVVAIATSPSPTVHVARALH
ncbi:Rhs family protein [Labilithrix luteola]|uniref:Rhs family protein n=1 Tax=Labilithrix luteola TaxID=1391654 RepID=A0A0K1PN20_9BACT|nr:Rhs family protein [Labilithrix luteola]